ncbi:MAG TPA: helix-turn-helix domain-containing protein [Ktedonosporobacter sp.]|jgi:sugar diacid utilization regulator|nr:helix-turn-helix domain-containing protein [Ktedonosporobacter sp.]
MSTQVFTLNQICHEQCSSETSFALSEQQDASPGAIAVTYSPTIKLCEVLRHLVTALTRPYSLDEMLHTVAILATMALDVDLCVILLKDQARDYLRLYTSSPTLRDKSVLIRPISMEQDLWECLHSSIIHAQLPQLCPAELEQLNPLKNVQYKTLIPVPLIAGSEYIGLMNCYSSKTRLYGNEDQLLLCTIANQMALAIKHRQYIDEDVLAHKTLVNTFVTDLLSGQSGNEEALSRQACFLGFDLARPHVVTLVELSYSEELPVSHLSARSPSGIASREDRFLLYESAVQQLQQYIQEAYPGSLVDERDNLLVCLLCQNDDCEIDQLTSWMDQLIQRVCHERHLHLYAGVGNPCRAMSDYQRGYAEAHEALELGKLLLQENGCSQFNALGAYRYIYRFAHADMLSDQYQEQVSAIVEYDQRKKTNLLDTLEMYLECGGHIAKASSHIDIHRNTLLQRLERLQKLCTIDLEELRHRLPLLIAIKIYRLRACSTCRQLST